MLKQVGACAFAVSVLLMPMSLAQAQDRYGSVVYSPTTQSVGWSNNARSRAAADQQAAANCGAADCRRILWYRNGCGALAYGSTGYGAGWGIDTAVASRWAAQTRQQCLRTPSEAAVRTMCTSNAGRAGSANRRARIVSVAGGSGDSQGCNDFVMPQRSPGVAARF